MTFGALPGYRSMRPVELSERLASGDRLQVIDVREPMEVGIASLAGAVSIPLSTLPERIGEIDRDNPVVVLCHHGIRSASACAWLVREGFTDVANLSGGIDAWSTDVDPAVPRY
jgi:rhodanese-related sulfurtransferase